MGYSLILDTSSKNLVVGLANENEVLRKVQYYAWQRQSEMTVQEIHKIMTELNISFDESGILCGTRTFSEEKFLIDKRFFPSKTHSPDKPILIPSELIK